MSQENLDADYLQRLYRLRFPALADGSRAALWRVIVERSLQSRVPASGTVLDIGCGYGEFLNHVRAARRIGVDLNPDTRALLHADVEFHAGDVRDLSFLPDGSIDLVFTSNFLEHMPSKGDVERVLREAWRVLKPGGQVLAVGPNLRYLAGEYWDFWDHHTAITDRSLMEIFELSGLEIVECIPRYLPYTTRSALPSSPWLVRLYLAMPFVWPLFGRQFLVRGRKR